MRDKTLKNSVWDYPYNSVYYSILNGSCYDNYYSVASSVRSSVSQSIFYSVYDSITRHIGKNKL